MRALTNLLALLSYADGKNYELKFILKHIPQYLYYDEPFAVGASIFS